MRIIIILILASILSAHADVPIVSWMVGTNTTSTLNLTKAQSIILRPVFGFRITNSVVRIQMTQIPAGISAIVTGTVHNAILGQCDFPWDPVANGNGTNYGYVLSVFSNSLTKATASGSVIYRIPVSGSVTTTPTVVKYFDWKDTIHLNADYAPWLTSLATSINWSTVAQSGGLAVLTNQMGSGAVWNGTQWTFGAGSVDLSFTNLYYRASNPSNYCTLAAAAGLTNGLSGTNHLHAGVYQPAGAYLVPADTNRFVDASITNGLGGGGGVSASDVTNALNLAVSPSLTGTVARAGSALQGETDTLASVTARGSLMGTNYLTFFPIAEQVYLNTTGSYDDTNTDTNRITIMAHGGPSAGSDRGAKIVLRGNEYSASTGGDLDIFAGSPTDPRAGKLTLGTAGGYTILRQSGNWDFGGHSLSNGVYLGDGSALSGITAAQVGAVPTSGVTSIIYSNAALFELAGTAAGLTSGLPYGVSASTASNITRGVLGGETNGWTVTAHGGLWSKGDSVTNADLTTSTGLLPDGSLGTNSTRTVSNLTVKAAATVGTLNGLTPSTILTNIPAVITPVTLSLDAGNTATVQNVFYNDLGILATNITVVIGPTMTNLAQARSFWLDWSNTTYSITFPVGSFSNVTANTATTNKAWSSYWHAGKGQTIFTGGWR